MPFDVGAYTLTGPATLSAPPNGQIQANLTFSSVYSYSGQVNATCDATALPATQCTITPANPLNIASGGTTTAMVSINVPTDAAQGTYNININSQDVSGAPTASLTMALTVSQDFALGSLSPSSQTISAGQSTSFNFNVLPVGSSFTNPISFACSGAPTISLCSFTPDPATITNGSGSTAVVLSISTTANTAPRAPVSAVFLFAPLLAVFGIARRSRKGKGLTQISFLLVLLMLLLLLPSCGGGGSNGSSGGGSGGQGQGTQPGTYTITVVGTSGSLTHQSPSVTLIVSQ